MPSAKNVSVYIANNPKHWKAHTLELIVGMLDKSESGFFNMLFMDYLRSQGLIDSEGKPVKEKIAELEAKLEAKSGLPNLFDSPAAPAKT